MDSEFAQQIFLYEEAGFLTCLFYFPVKFDPEPNALP